MSTLVKYSYCLDCSWSASTADHSRQELSSLILEHAVETGHDIDTTSVDPDQMPPDRSDLNEG
jgi:predicted small metal-binding protein